MTIASGYARPARADSIFFPAMALAMALVVFAGFAPSYYLKSVFNAPPPISPLMAMHGAAFTGWIALLVAQTGLVAANRRDMHRALGAAGVALAAAMVVLGLMLAHDALVRGFTPPGGPPPAVFFIVPVGGILAFLVLVGLGTANRKRADAHKRYMLLATALLVEPAAARLPVVRELPPPVFFGIADLFIVAMIAYDFSQRGRIQRATWICAAVIVASQVLRLVIGFTPAWQAFANSLI